MADDKDISLIRHPDFRCFYAIGAVSAWTSHDFRINFYSEKVTEQEEDSLVNDVQVILPPKAVRELALALARSVREFEKSHGVSLKNGISTGEIELTGVIDSSKDPGGSKLSTKGVSDKILGPDFTKDLKKDIKKDLTKEMKQDLKKDIKKDLEKGLKQDLKKDLEKGLKQDLKKDLTKGLKQDLKKDIRTEVRGVIRSDKKKDKAEGTDRAKSANISKRGRRRVGRGRKTITKSK
jgi:hypothetical protein